VTDEPNKLADDTTVDVAEDAAAHGAGAPAEPVEEAAAAVDEQIAEEPITESMAEMAADGEVEVPAEAEPVDAEVGEDETAAGEPEADAEEPEASSEAVVAAEPEPEEEIRMDWYILKVQSNRERSISDALQRKIAIEGLSKYFGQVIVPTEKVTEFKGGKKKVVERKLYPGYIVVQMHINDDTWFAVRETSGVGDFTGAGGKPTPMLPHEVARIIQTEVEETDEAPKLDIKFSAGDKVKVREGNFESFEGEVSSIDEASGRVTVMINIFGRSTPVELEYWQIETV
jgi:transcriptional antiterminator NusG